MNMRGKKALIFIIAGLTALPGLYSLLRHPSAIFIYFKWLITGEIPDQLMPLWVTVLTFLAYAVYILRPVSAYGLFRFKIWGKNLAFVTLSLDFVISFISFVNLWTYYYRHPDALKLFEKMKRTLEKHQQSDMDVVVDNISMIPSYVIAAISLISVIILLKIDYRSLIKKA